MYVRKSSPKERCSIYTGGIIGPFPLHGSCRHIKNKMPGQTNYTIAPKQIPFLLSSQVFQMDDSNFPSDMIKTPDKTISHEDSLSSCKNLKRKFSFGKDDSIFTGNGFSFAPTLNFHEALEPTPFRDGTSLKQTSDSGMHAVAPDKTKTFKPFQSNKSSLDWKLNGIITFSETGFEDESDSDVSSSSSHPTNSEHPMASPLAETDAFNTPSAKRRRTESKFEKNKTPQLRPHQDVLWQEHFNTLLKFIREHGHCHVHYTFGHDSTLSKWVQRQRYQYKLKIAGKKSTLVDERQQKLESVGFIWDSHSAKWQQRLNQLLEYKKEHGHCRVPSTYPINPQLAMWVKSQRRQFKLYRSGLNSNLSEERLKSLNNLGFTWELRSVIDLRCYF